MRKHPIAARVITFCLTGGVAASMVLSGAGPARALSPVRHQARASDAASTSSTTRKTKCAGNVCETVTLNGDLITVTTTAKDVHVMCVKPMVTVVSPEGKVTRKAKPRCDQTRPVIVFVIRIKNLTRPVTVYAQWTHVYGEPRVTFGRFMTP